MDFSLPHMFQLKRRQFLKSTCCSFALITTADSFADERPAPQLGEVWDPSLFPWMLSTAFFQEDVPTGPVSSHRARGIAPYLAKQTNGLFRPTKLDGNQGIEFSPFSGQHLSFPAVRDSLRLYRWCLAILRVDDRGDTDKVTQLFNINEGSQSNNRHPGIQYRPAAGRRQGLDLIWHGANKKSILKANLPGNSFVADGKVWNVCLTHRRNGQLYASTNGIDSGYRNKTSSWVWPLPFKTSTSRIGDRTGLECGWAYDCLILGQTELSETNVKKLEGWAMWRIGRQLELPDDHPYRLDHPVVDEDDFPYIYQFDKKSWNDWGAQLKRQKTSEHMGQPALRPDGYQRVFFDDFRINTIAPSNKIPDQIANWFGPGWNTAVGNSGQMLSPAQKPLLYKHTPQPQQPVRSGGSLTLSLKEKNGRWFAPAIYTVDESGKGLSWEGETIFRLRCKAPFYDKVPGGFFPAFWSYALQPLFLRHLERIEIDFWEFDGKNDNWLNGGSSHVHRAHRFGPLSQLERDAKHYKVLGTRIVREDTAFEQPFHFWDGHWHLWEFRIERDFTYLNVTLEKNGEETWIELFRCPTPLEYFERKYLIINFALRANDGLPNPNQDHNIEIDYVEVLQKQQKLEIAPPLFASVPKIKGVAKAGSLVSCYAPLNEPIADVWYHWFADGYPRAVNPSSNYLLSQDDVGKEIRCLVRAVGATNQPEAWSNIIKPVSL